MDRWGGPRCSVFGVRVGVTQGFIPPLHVHAGTTIVNNTFKDCQHGILVGGGRDVVVSGNVFENCDWGIQFVRLPGQCLSCMRLSLHASLACGMMSPCGWALVPAGRPRPGLAGGVVHLQLHVRWSFGAAGTRGVIAGCAAFVLRQ